MPWVLNKIPLILKFTQKKIKLIIASEVKNMQKNDDKFPFSFTLLVLSADPSHPNQPSIILFHYSYARVHCHIALYLTHFVLRFLIAFMHGNSHFPFSFSITSLLYFYRKQQKKKASKDSKLVQKPPINLVKQQSRALFSTHSTFMQKKELKIYIHAEEQ